MKPAEKQIMEDYRRYLPDYLEIESIVAEKLKAIIRQTGIKTLIMQHRVKAEDSLKGKLLRVEGKYKCFEQLTDILGARIVCFFSDEIDKLGKQIENSFVIDWENTSDKRTQIKDDSFGYLSMHYICSLDPKDGYPERLTCHKFEVQIRTALQHVWSEMSHNTGYKSEFGLPRAINRDFSRMAGLLEIADNEFMHIRDDAKAYNDDVRDRITRNEAKNVPINTVSIREYLRLNPAIRGLNNCIAAVCGAEIEDIDATSYITQLDRLNVRTLGALDDMIARDGDLALQMARDALMGTELDILSNVVGLYYLCRAELVLGGYTEAQAAKFLELTTGDYDRALRQAGSILERYGKE